MGKMVEATMDNVIVLLDAYTQSAVENIAYDSLSKHCLVLTDIREISDTHFSSRFVFCETAVPAMVTPEILGELKENYELEPFLIYQRDEVGALFKDVATCIKAGYGTLEWNLIYAILHEDSAILGPYIRMRTEPVEFSTLLKDLPPELTAPVDRMYKSYLTMGSGYSRLLDENARLKEQLFNFRSVGRKTTQAIVELQDLLDEVVKENRTFAAQLSESYDQCFSGVYTTRPRTLLIKCISHLAGVDNLIAILYSVLTRQYRVSVKVVKLCDAGCANVIRYVPNSYYFLSDSYNTYDVLTNDFIASIGGYKLLFNLLMLNRSELDFLIVHDMRSTLNPALDEGLVDLQLNEMSADYAVLMERENILSDWDGAAFQWDYAKVAKYTGTAVAKLSSLPVIGAILDYLV